MAGVVVAVCTGKDGELWKTPVTEGVLVEEYGLRGDRHAGPTRVSHRDPSVRKSNDRQISIVAHEVLEEIGRALGVHLEAGSFGENVCVAGLGDLSEVRPGWLLRTDRGIVFRVTAQNDPCANLRQYHPQMVKASFGRRGLVAIVEAGAGLTLAPGDRVELQPD